jgi:flagellar M-ring protein FliF
MTAEEYLSSKISVLALPFYVEPEPVVVTQSLLASLNLPFPDWVVYVAAGVLLLLIILAIVLIIVIKKKKKKKKQQAEMDENQQVLEEILAAAAEPGEPQGADVMNLQTEKTMELRKSIRRFVDENPELAAQMIKIWLRGGEDGA